MQSTAAIRPVVVAVEHPLVHPEALHIAAATGRPVVEVRDAAALERSRHKAFALLVDAPFNPHTDPSHPSDNVFVVTDQPDPANPRAFALPAQAPDLLRALGMLTQRATVPAAAGGKVLAVGGAGGGGGGSGLAAAVRLRA
ncbi:pilus assembly protein, partial [Corynebacterium sp. Q4381]